MKERCWGNPVNPSFHEIHYHPLLHILGAVLARTILCHVPGWITAKVLTVNSSLRWPSVSVEGVKVREEKYTQGLGNLQGWWSTHITPTLWQHSVDHAFSGKNNLSGSRLPPSIIIPGVNFVYLIKLLPHPNVINLVSYLSLSGCASSHEAWKEKQVGMSRGA